MGKRRHAVAIMTLSASAFVLASTSAAGSATGSETATASTCATLDYHFAFGGGTPDSITVPIGPILGMVDAVRVTMVDEPHPTAPTQPGERVRVVLDGLDLGTTPDLPDDQREATYELPVGGFVDADTITLVHAPLARPDSVTVATVCVDLDLTATTTTVSPTTIPPTTTLPSTTLPSTTLPPTTSAPTTTTEAPSPPSSSTSAPTTTIPAATTTLAPPVTTTQPPPGEGSFSAVCAAEGSGDLSSLVWTARGTLPAETVAGTPITLSDQEWTVSIPSSVLENAASLGLVGVGDSIPVSISGTISATGTAESARSASGLTSSVVVAADANGAVQPAVAKTSAPDMVFTPNAESVAFRMSTASASLELGMAEPVELACTFDTAGPPIVASPPSQEPPPPGELAFTGPNTYLYAAIIMLVLLDVGYLMWSAGRPERRRLS